jgi:hypothetical protein
MKVRGLKNIPNLIVLTVPISQLKLLQGSSVDRSPNTL